MTPTIRRLVALLVLGPLLSVGGCQTAMERRPIEKDGRLYGVTRGLFRNRWWHYYERALSFADGEFWKQAELDLREAIRQRDEDQRRARTYGMHFIDYFPHGELGVVLYHQALETNTGDKLRASIRELKASVEMVKSAKAEHYLDLARKALIEWEGGGNRPPDITIESPGSPVLTNALELTIRGTVRDEDDFVRTVTVGGRAVRIDVSRREVAFTVSVPLQNGRNRIPVTAGNLAGLSSETRVDVDVDRVGPVIGETGYVFDGSGLTGITVSGRTAPVQGREAQVTNLFPEYGEGDAVQVRATDRAGNTTEAEIRLASASAAGQGGWLARNRFETVVPDAGGAGGSLLASTGCVKPTISLKNPAVERTTYLDRMVIDGKIQGDPNGVRLMVFGDQAGELLRLEPPGAAYHFNCMAPLEPGKNVIDLQAVSPCGRDDGLTVVVERKIPSVRKSEARLKLAVCPFERTKTSDVNVELSVGFEDRLVTALTGHEPARFAHVEDLDLSVDKGVDEDRARSLAKEKGYHYILFGKIEERKNSRDKHTLILKSQFEDVEGNPVVIEKETEVYGEDLDKDNSPDKLTALSEYMGIKLIDELPLLEGKIIQKKDVWIGIDIGKEKKAKKGIDLIVYELMEEPIPGFGHETEELGLAKIEKALENKSLAKLYDAENPEEVKPEHLVITR